MRNCVYHYCSIESLIKIVEGKTLRFSDIRKSNDSKEINWLWQQYVDYLKERIKEQPFAYSCLTSEVRRQLKTIDFFACCFSGAEDSLSMWGRYANKGVAIGFDKCKLCEWSKQISINNNKAEWEREKIDFDSPVAKFGKVEYYSQSHIKELIKKKCLHINPIDDGFVEVYSTAPFCKQDFWKEEKEWRVVLPIDYYRIESLSFLDETGIQAIPDQRFGFKSFCLVEFSPYYVKEIILAPNCEANKNDIKKLLIANGFNASGIRIKRSRGSLRR